MTLGLLTKVEFDLRDELSIIFNSCIRVRRCVYENVDINGESNSTKSWLIFKNSSTQKVCVSKGTHRNTPYNTKWVSIINILFSLLAISHLSYLGSTFDGKEEVSIHFTHLFIHLTFFPTFIVISSIKCSVDLARIEIFFSHNFNHNFYFL